MQNVLTKIKPREEYLTNQGKKPWSNWKTLFLLFWTAAGQLAVIMLLTMTTTTNNNTNLRYWEKFYVKLLNL